MKVETLAGISKTASAMDITVSLGEEGLTFRLAKDRHTITGMLPWPLLDKSRDPHGACAIMMGDMFNAMKVAQGVDGMPVIDEPGYWSGTGRAGNGSDM